MNNRTLEIAALVLIAWALLAYDRDEVRHRVVVTGPGSSHLDWEDAQWEDATEDDAFDGDDVDVEAGEPSLRMSLAEARRAAREERLRLRSEIREQWQQVRQEGSMTRTSTRSGVKSWLAAARFPGCSRVRFRCLEPFLLKRG